MSAAHRARLFLTLARYAESGLPPDAALDECAGDMPGLAGAAARAAALTRAGQRLDQAGTASGLFVSWESRLLALGARHGRLDLTLSELARHYEKSAAWWGRLRARLVLPAAVLVLGWLLLPLPRLFAGTLSPGAYLITNAVLVLLIWLGWRKLSGASGYPAFLDALPGPPGRLVTRFHRGRFLNGLALLIEAGVPAREAVQAALESCRSRRLRARWQPALVSLDAGATLAASLKRHGVLDAGGYSLIDSGEASGRLVDMLRRECGRLDEEIQLSLEVLGEWLPRVVYLLVVVALVNQLGG